MEKAKGGAGNRESGDSRVCVKRERGGRWGFLLVSGELLFSYAAKLGLIGVHYGGGEV